MLATSNTHLSHGKKAEEYVAEQLKRNGFAILAQNYRKRYGEIDVIAKKRNIVAFVEVKYRTNIYFNISEVIVPSKQRKIISTAKTFIAQHAFDDNTIYRFDVAIVTKKDAMFSLEYYQNAFGERNE